MKRSANRRVFPNQYNGVGGHLERHEDPRSGAIREILEETGLFVQNTQLRAIHNIDAGEASGILLFVYTAESSSRQVEANHAEGELHWVRKDDIQNYDLVEDLPIVLPRILTMADGDQPLFVHVSYDEADRIQVRFAEDSAERE